MQYVDCDLIIGGDLKYNFWSIEVFLRDLSLHLALGLIFLRAILLGLLLISYFWI